MNEILNSSNCFGREEFLYILKQCELSEFPDHLKNHLLVCPLCAEALNGYGQHQNLSKLIKQVSNLRFKAR